MLTWLLVPWFYDTRLLWCPGPTVLLYYGSIVVLYYGTTEMVLLYYGSIWYMVLRYFGTTVIVLRFYGYMVYGSLYGSTVLWYCSDTILFYVVQDYGTAVLWFYSSMLVHGWYLLQYMVLWYYGVPVLQYNGIWDVISWSWTVL